MTKNNLFSDFNPNTKQEWIDKITKDLKGADFDKKMIKKSEGEIDIYPFYRKEDLNQLEGLDQKPGEFPYKRGVQDTENNWEIREDIIDSDLSKASSKIASAIENEVDAIGISSCFVENKLYGVPIQSYEDFEQTFNDCSSIPKLHLDSGLLSPIYLKYLITLLEKRNQLKNYHGSVEYDLVSEYFTGKINQEIFKVKFKELSSIIQLLKEKKSNIQCISIKSEVYQSNGTPVELELAYLISQANFYISVLLDEGLSLEDILPRIKFKVSIGPKFFQEIAKLRALRILWSNLVISYREEAKDLAKISLTAKTSFYNLTSYDPEVNFLRTTTEAISGILGGADTVVLNGYDEVNTERSDLSERMTRNIQYVVKNESYLDKVADPAGGSFYLENLTNQMALKAWENFQKIESQGGVVESFNQNLLQEKLEAFHVNNLKNIEKRKLILLGTNQYPLMNEKNHLAKKLGLEVKISGKKLSFDQLDANSKIEDYLGESTKSENSITINRLASSFESLRFKTEQADKTPKIGLILFGNKAFASARSNFAANFFGCAGFEVKTHPRVENINVTLSWIEKEKFDAITFCAGDTDYLSVASGFISQIKEKCSVKSFVVAGYPKDDVEALQKVGVDEFIHIKTNVYESLVKFQEELI
jgi:methylmalonyl-CoA mutase